MKIKTNLLFNSRLSYRTHERPAVESEAPEEREPSLSDAQTESGRKKILNAAREKIVQLRKEAEKGDFDSEERIDEYYEHLHPKIAQYVHDREEESGNRRA